MLARDSARTVHRVGQMVRSPGASLSISIFSSRGRASRLGENSISFTNSKQVSRQLLGGCLQPLNEAVGTSLLIHHFHHLKRQKNEY